jgi:L-fuconolactonase
VDFNPYLDVVFKAFGPERVMTGSDWPVCLLAGDYKKVTGIVDTFISGMSPEIQQKISGQNCIDFYGLDVR